MKTTFISSILLIALCGGLNAQQDAMFTKYMFNSLSMNPAYAGSHENLRVSAQARRQWMNFPGSPTTLLASIDGTAADNRMGWGGLLGYDRIGLNYITDLHGNYAYRFGVGEGTLALGIRAGVTWYRSNLASADLGDLVVDPVFDQNVSFFIPKAGIGVYYQQEKFYAGVSVPTLVSIDPRRDFSLKDDSTFARRHYFLHTGMVFAAAEGFSLKPSVLIKAVKGAPVEADLNLQLYFLERFGVGVSYRTGDAVVCMAELFTRSGLRVGYSYDFTLSRINNHGGGAHEIIVGYEWGGTGDKGKMRDIKYF